jgi:hypothetical protein
MTIDQICTALFFAVVLPGMYRLFTYPRVFLYREEKCQHQVEPVIVAACITFWGRQRKAYSDDSGSSFFWADTCETADVKTSYWLIKMKERRKAFLEKEGLK